MDYPNIYTAPVIEQLVTRVNKLSPDSKPQWGKMSAGQMAAHCNVSYEMVYDNIHPKPNGIMRLILKLLVKDKVCGMEPYKRSSPTAPQFKIVGDRDFNAEKDRLINYLRKTQQLGEKTFEQKESHSFGKLNANEWNSMFYKHLDHHLTQFGV
jgi:hypothetical protein